MFEPLHRTSFNTWEVESMLLAISGPRQFDIFVLIAGSLQLGSYTIDHLNIVFKCMELYQSKQRDKYYKNANQSRWL